MIRIRLIFAGLVLGSAIAACGPAGTAGAPGPAEPAETFQNERVHHSAQVRLWVPPSWAVDDSADDTLVMTSPDQDLGIAFLVVDSADLGSALLTVGANVMTEIDDLELVGTPTEVAVGGMPALFQDGRGTRAGAPIELSLGVIDTPADKYLLIVGAAEPATLHRHEAEIMRVMENIKPM